MLNFWTNIDAENYMYPRFLKSAYKNIFRKNERLKSQT